MTVAHLQAHLGHLSLEDETAIKVLTTPPLLQDIINTETCKSQRQTVDECLPLLQQALLAYDTAAQTDGPAHSSFVSLLPELSSSSHVRFLYAHLVNHPTHASSFLTPLLASAIPATFPPSAQTSAPAASKARLLPLAYDASRPWLLYWNLTALSLLRQDVAPFAYGVGQTLTVAQNTDVQRDDACILGTGGYGGGHGQASHVAPTYAAILSLATVYAATVNHADARVRQEGLDAIRAIDRRGLWCWLGQLKQADGGFRMCIGGEADVRGCYCSLIIIKLLNLPLDLPRDSPAVRQYGLSKFTDGLAEYLSRCQTYEGGISGTPQNEAHGAYTFCAVACLALLGSPAKMLPRYLDMDLLISWLSMRQCAPEGGFSGRTNKLVDGCYSHWVGGCWPIIEAALEKSKSEDLYNREGLIAYILCCSQAGSTKSGGLADKPSTRPDAYHTCYTLGGLASAVRPPKYEEVADGDAAYGWREGTADENGQLASRLTSLHPVFVIPWTAVEQTRRLFGSSSLI